MTKRKSTRKTTNKKKSEAQKQILLEKREQMIKKLTESKREESAAELDRGDDLDRAAASRDQEINYMLSSREREELRAIEEALEKIEMGVYGVCERCEKTIGAKRIKALPLAPYCHDCQSEMEVAQRRNRELGL
ncbi:MAG: TraR/DksA family transcriptional regulator [bacterium]